MTRQRVFAACLFAALLYQIALVFRPFLFPMLWAAILAHAAFPLHNRLTALLKGRAAASAWLLTLAMMGLVMVPLALMTAVLIRETGRAYEASSAWIRSGGLRQLPDLLTRLPFGQGAQRLIADYAPSFGDMEELLLQSSKATSAFIVDQAAGLARNAFLLIGNFLVMVITLYFFFRNGRSLVDAVYENVPLEDAYKARLLSRLDKTVTAVVKGIIVTAIVQGLLAGAAYAALGVPIPVSLTVLTIMLAPLPFGGTALVWAPVAAYILWTGPIWKGVTMLAWGAGGVSTVDSVLKPLLIGKGTRLPALFLFFSMLGGLGAYGLIGLFLGPVLLAVFLTAVQLSRE